ncbi:MAG: hypothetical protein D6732_15255 [Methanobacteriota archaeon]|nr:MAG: hypothetical protein D6732_15255 [Euryarchaeota archaeon]
METSPFHLKGNIEQTISLFSRPDLLFRIKLFFFYNLFIVFYYLYLIVVAITSGLFLPAVYILLFSFGTMILTTWLSSFKDKVRQIFLVFSLIDFFIMSILSPGNLVILFSVIFRIWILGVNKRSSRFFH